MIDVHAAARFLASPVPPAPSAELPAADLSRSRAAARTGEIAAAAKIRVFHYELRVALPIADELEWQDGVLPEPKYGAFRHDVPIASFHPGHRAKWGAHELCHALVGYAWRPGASPLLLATAARLAEIVPVVLWYWLDEIGLRRCPRHDGPLFRASCPACARAAAEGPIPADPARAEALAADAARFLDRELAAVARTRRLGVPCPHVWGSLDLCSDGIAYAAGHAERLGSAAFAAFAERFPNPVLWPDLDALEARVVAVARAIAEGAPLDTPTADWARIDLGQRLLDVWADCDGDCADEILAVADGLAAGGTPAEALAAYAEVYDTYELPAPQDVFAVGYDVPGVPSRSVEQARAGLATATPMVMTLCDDAGVDLVAAFVAADDRAREPLGARFARWLAGAHGGALADLAAYEAALRAARGEPEAVALGDGDGVRFAEGLVVRSYPFDVVGLAERVDTGETAGIARGGRVEVAADGDPVTLAVGRTREGELVLAEIRPEVAEDPRAATPEERAALSELGVLVAERWTV